MITNLNCKFPYSRKGLVLLGAGPSVLLAERSSLTSSWAVRSSEQGERPMGEGTEARLEVPASVLPGGTLGFGSHPFLSGKQTTLPGLP